MSKEIFVIGIICDRHDKPIFRMNRTFESKDDALNVYAAAKQHAEKDPNVRSFVGVVERHRLRDMSIHGQKVRAFAKEDVLTSDNLTSSAVDLDAGKAPEELNAKHGAKTYIDNAPNAKVISKPSGAANSSKPKSKPAAAPKQPPAEKPKERLSLDKIPFY